LEVHSSIRDVRDPKVEAKLSLETAKHSTMSDKKYPPVKQSTSQTEEEQVSQPLPSTLALLTPSRKMSM
jgi:hypothetical protein